MTGRRWYVPSVLGLLLCGGVMFFASSRSWVTGRVRAEGLPSDQVAVSGADALPLVSAMGLVVAAAALAVLATRGVLRRAVGALVVVAAGVAVAVAAAGRDALDDAFTDAVAQSPAFTGANVTSPHHAAWPWLVVVVGVLAVALGVLTVLSSRAWPTMSGRYDAPTATVAAVDPAESDGADVWKALDEGRDPTV